MVNKLKEVEIKRRLASMKWLKPSRNISKKWCLIGFGVLSMIPLWFNLYSEDDSLYGWLAMQL